MTPSEIQKKHQSNLMRIPGVIGVGVGMEEEESVLVVLVDKYTRKLKRTVPKELDGYRLVVKETDPVQAQ